MAFYCDLQEILSKKSAIIETLNILNTENTRMAPPQHFHSFFLTEFRLKTDLFLTFLMQVNFRCCLQFLNEDRQMIKDITIHLEI